jgi:hypothetical protein
VGASILHNRIEAYIVRAHFGQTMDLATKNNERLIVDRCGEPAPAPDWLEKAGIAARQREFNELTSADIDGEVGAYQRKSDPALGRTL